MLPSYKMEFVEFNFTFTMRSLCPVDLIQINMGVYKPNLLLHGFLREFNFNKFTFFCWLGVEGFDNLSIEDINEIIVDKALNEE